MNFENMTWRELAGIVIAIRKEMKRRNPIGVNVYVPYLKGAEHALTEIANAESHHRTSEFGPKEPRTK